MILAEELACDFVYAASFVQRIKFDKFNDKMCVTLAGFERPRSERRDLPTRRGRARGTLRNLT